MVEVTPGAKSTSSSSFSIDAIISKDGGPVTASSPVPQFADTRLCAAQPPPTSSSSYLEHLHQRAQQQEQRAGTGGAVTGGRDIYRVQALNGDLSPTRGLVARSDGTGKSDLRGSGIDGTGSMDVLTASAPRHHMHPMSLPASSSASSALLSTSSMASQLPPHHPHFPSPSLSSPHHPSPHHPIPHHHLLGAVSDSAAASLFSAATKSPMYSSLSGLHGGPHDLGSASAAHTAGLFGQSPLSYAGMSQAAAAAEASGLSTLHALASQKSALHHAGSLHGLAAGGMTLPGVHQQFPLYSRLSWPYFHRYTGSEPSFLLPFRKPKRIRTAFSPSQLLRLEHAFEKNHYVVGQERKDLAVNLSLTETQVKVWFQNRRTKHKRLTTEEEQEKHRTSKSSPDNSRDEDDMMDD